MVTTGMDHSVFERSLIILENEHACTEDKIVACVELEGYFNIISKNKTDITSQPIRNLWEKLVRVLLHCFEKKNTKLHAPVLQTLKIGIQVLPKGLGLGMQVASQCYSVLLKTCQEKEENIEPLCKTHVLVELLRCLSRFDDPQFIDAITSTGVGYTEHKGLINKCVECNLDIPDNKDQQDVDLWISYLRLESLYFTTRLMKLCGALLKSHFVEDLDFWLELLLPHLFTFNEFYNSALGKDCGSDTRKATREAMEVLLTLIPPEEQIKLENWPKIKKDIKDNYADKMVKLVGVIPDWASVWCTVLDVLDGELIRKGNNHLINKLLNVEERAFKYDRTEVRVQAFICWRRLVDKFLPHGIEVSSDAVQRSVRLLVQPLQPNNAKTDIMSRQKFNTWWHLVRHLETGMEKHLKSVLMPFLNYCFGSSKSKEIAPGKKFPALHIPCAKVLAYILDLEPIRQPVPDNPMDITNVEECIVHPCSVPLLSNCNLFLNVSEELFHCVGESIVILSSRSEDSVCSQLLITVWNSLLRHIAVILNANDIAPERVVKLIQDLLRLVQSLTERSNSAAPSLANHCISSLLEGLIMGPHALSPPVLSSPSYYVGSAQLMTGTPALFFMEIMVSRPLLQHATSHSRYIPILKVILDIGIHHHKVLEFMQSVMKQLETVAGAYYNVNTIERSSLCTVWSNVAQTLTEYLKDHHCVNQGNDKHHDLGCLYMVLLFPFYHFYSISYKQTLETLEVWRELYKTFHHAAIQSVPTLDMNEICETMILKISQALTKHCPITANQALPLLQAMQNIITTIPFSDICRQSVKSKTKFLLLPDRGRSSKPTSYITNTMSLIVKMSQLFAMYERSGEWYNTVGSLIMNCLESLFKNMKAANVAAAVPMVSGFSDSVLSLLQASPVQDGTTKFWTESLQRMWRCYFTFIETYVPQKSVKDFLGWMSVLLEIGFKHSDVEIRNITVEFWDSIVVPAFDLDKTNVPQALKKAREKCVVKGNDDMPNTDISNASDNDKPVSDTVFAVPNEAEKPKKAHQSLIQQLTNKGHILTKHQKEVFRRQKDDIPALYSSTLQPVQENSILSESSLDTSDFIAPQRIMETTTRSGKFKESLSPLKVLEPPSCLRRTADYRKKMMIDHEGSIVLASIGDSSVHEENAMTEPFNTETDVPQIQENVEPSVTPVSLAFVTDPVDPTGNRKLNLETVAVRLPSTIRDSNKDLPEQSEDENVHHSETDNSVRMSLPTASPVTVSSIDTPISFPLEEPTVCSSIIMGSNTVAQTHNILAPSHMDVQEVVELPSTPLTVLPDKTLSSNNVTVLPKSSGLSGIIPDSGKLLLTESCKKLISNPLQKVMKKKSGNTLTNYFKPVSITLTADEDEVEQTRKGGARTIHLSIEPVPTTAATTTVCSNTAVEGQTSDNLSNVIPTIIENVNEILEASSMSSVEVSTTTMDSVENDGSLSPVKVVVEKVEDFSLTKTFAALETMTPVFNIENGKVSPQSEVSSSSRRKTRSPLRRTPEDPKLPPFKTSTKPITEQEVLSIEKSSKLNTKSEKKMKNEKLSKSGRQSFRGRKSKSTRMAKVENNTDTENNTLDENTSPSLLQAPSKRKYKPRKSKAKLLDIAEDLKAIKEGALASLETISNSDDKQSISETKLCLTPLEVKTKKLAVDVIEEAIKVPESHNIESSTHKLNEFDSDKNNDLADVSNLNEVDTIKTSAFIESEKQNILGSIEELKSKCNNEVNIISEKMDKQSLSNKTATLNSVNNEDEMNEQVNNIGNVDTKSKKSDKEIISDSSKIKEDETKAAAQTRSDKQKEIVSKEKDANLAKKSKTNVNTPKKDIRSLFPKVKLSSTKEKNTSHGKNRSFCGISDPRLLRQRRTRSELNISISTPCKVDELAIKNKLAQVVIEPCSSIIDSRLSRHRKSLSHLESTITESPKKAESADSIKLKRIVKELSIGISDSGQSKHTKSIPKLEITSESLEKDFSTVQNKLEQALPDLSISIADARLSRHKKNISKLDTSASEILEKEKSDIQDRKSVSKFDPSTSETPGKDKSDVQDKLNKNSLSKFNTSTSEIQEKDKSDVQDKIAVTVYETSASNADPRLLRHRKSVSKCNTSTSETLGKDKSDVQDKIAVTVCETSASNADPRLLRHRKSMSKCNTSTSETLGKDKSDVQDKLAVIVCETSASNADPRLLRHRKSVSKCNTSTSETLGKDKSDVQDKIAETVCEMSASNVDPRLLRHRKSVSKFDTSTSETLGKDKSDIQDKLAETVCETSASNADPRLLRHRKSMSKLDTSTSETLGKDKSDIQDKLAETVCETSASNADPRLLRHRKSMSKLDTSTSETLGKDKSDIQDKLAETVCETSASNADPRLLRHRKSVSKLDTSTSETLGKDKSDIQDKIAETVCETSASNADPRLLRHRKSVSKLDTSTSETLGKDKSDIQDKLAETVCETSASNADPRLLRHRKSVSKLDTSTSETLGKDKSDIQDKLAETVCETSASNADPRLLRHRKSVSKLDTSTSETLGKDKSDIQDKLGETVCETSASNADPRPFRHKKSMSKLDTSTFERTEKDKSDVQDKLAMTVCETYAKNADLRLLRHRKSVSKLDISTSKTLEKDKSDVEDKLAVTVGETPTTNADPKLSRHRKSVSKLDCTHSETQEKNKYKSEEVAHEASASIVDPRKLRLKKIELHNSLQSESQGKDKSAVQNKSVCEISSTIADPRVSRQRKSTSSIPAQKDEYAVQSKLPGFHESSVSNGDPRFSKHRKSVPNLHSTITVALEKSESATSNKLTELGSETSVSIVDPRFLRHRKSISQLDFSSSSLSDKSEFASRKKVAEVANNTSGGKSNSEAENSVSITSNNEVKESISNKRKRTKRKIDKDFISIDDFIPKERRRKLNNMESDVSKNRKSTLLSSTSDITNKVFAEKSKTTIAVTAVEKFDVPETLEDIEKEIKAITEGSHAEMSVTHNYKVANCSDKESRLAEISEEKVSRKKPRYSIVEDKAHDSKQPLNVLNIRISRNLCSTTNKKMKGEFEKSLQPESKVVPETQSLNSHASEGISKLKNSQESEPKTNLDQQLSEAVIEISEMFLKQNSNKETPKNSDKFKEIISSTSGLKENIPPIERVVEDVHSIPESLDIIESSQESTTSVSIVGRPIMHKCSVTVRRIDTTLEPGSKIDMSQGDQKLMILVPEDPDSPYKLFSPEKCHKNDENFNNNSKLLSVTKSLTSKLEAVQENIHESFKTTSLKDQSKKEESNEIKLLNKEKDCVEPEISVIQIIKDDVLKTEPKRDEHKKSEDKIKDVTKSDTPKQLPESEEKTKDLANSKSRHLPDIEEKSENGTKSVTPKPKSKQLPDLEEKIKDVTPKSKPKQLPDSEEKTKDFTKTFTPKLKSKQLSEVIIPEETKIESSKTKTEIAKQSDSSLAGLEIPKFRSKKSNIILKPEDNVIQEESAPKLRSKKQDLLSEISSDTSKSRCEDMEVSVTSDDGPILQCEQEHNSTIIENKSKVIEKDDKTKGRLKQQDDKLKMNVTKPDLIKHRSKLSISKLEDTDSNVVSKSKCKVQSEELLQSRTKHSAVVPTDDAAPSSSKNYTAKLKTKQSIVESTSSLDNSQKLKTVQQIDSVKTKDRNKNPVKDRQKSDENNAVQEDITKVKHKISSDRKVVSIQDTNTTSKTEKDVKKSDTLKNKLESTVSNKTAKKIHDVESPKKSKPREDSSFKLRIIEESISGSDSKNNKDESYDSSSKAVQIKVSMALKENAIPLVSSPSKRKESVISSEEISNEDRSIEMVVSKIKRLAQNSEHFIPKQVQNIQNSVAKKCQDINSTPTKLSTSTSDSEKTPSPSPTKPILTSPSSLLKAFSSPSSGSLKLSQKSHQRRIEGRAQYMVGLAVGTSQQEDSQVSSPISSRGYQEVRSIMTTPVSRKRLLYTLSDDDTVPLSPELDRRQESDMEHESSSQTPVSESRISSDLPVKRVLKQNTGEQNTPPSKKKRVWFPDPEVSGTRVFTAYEEMEDASAIRSYNRNKMMLSLKKRDKKLRMTKLRSPTTVSTKKIIRPANIVQNEVFSQNSPDLSGIVSQGSIEDIFTELLNSQDSFFPPLVSCMHPIESIAHQLTTHVMWTKALVVELNRKGIRTVGDLSRLDEASINRLPVATPRIAHTREVLENYFKIVGQGSDKGDGHPSGDSTLTPSPQSTEPVKITTADVVRFMNSNKGSFSSLLEDVCNSSQCSGRLNQEICQMLCSRNRPSSSASGSSEPEENISEIVARFGRDTIVEHLLHTDTMHLRSTHSIILKWIMSNGVENILGKLPQLELARYIVKNNFEGLCKVLTENPALQEKVFQNYFNSQLATDQLCHKELFDKLFTGDRNNTLLNAMQSFLMLKKSTEEILHKMPVESVMQFATSRLSLVDKIGLCVEGMLVDTSLEVPVSHYHKLVHAVAKKVSRSDFATINYKVMMELLDKD